mmetsp:Transcript_16878/g.39421  ORF Transcript_16878/g.39421 Transcript_16878/m.39421 type:complete len:287 (-) Transcript_16878:92-952(-)
MSSGNPLPFHIPFVSGAAAREPLVRLAKSAPEDSADALQRCLAAAALVAGLSVLVSSPWSLLFGEEAVPSCERPFGAWLLLVACLNSLQVPLRLANIWLIQRTRGLNSDGARCVDEIMLTNLLNSRFWAVCEGVSTFTLLCHVPGALWVCNTAPCSADSYCVTAHSRTRVVVALAIGRIVFNVRMMGELASKHFITESSTHSPGEVPGENAAAAQSNPKLRKQIVLPRVPCSHERSSTKTGAPCSICLCKLWPGQGIRVLPCGHYFHAGCIDKWFDVRCDCPLCRS